MEHGLRGGIGVLLVLVLVFLVGGDRGQGDSPISQVDVHRGAVGVDLVDGIAQVGEVVPVVIGIAKAVDVYAVAAELDRVGAILPQGPPGHGCRCSSSAGWCRPPFSAWARSKIPRPGLENWCRNMASDRPACRAPGRRRPGSCWAGKPSRCWEITAKALTAELSPTGRTNRCRLDIHLVEAAIGHLAVARLTGSPTTGLLEMKLTAPPGGVAPVEGVLRSAQHLDPLQVEHLQDIYHGRVQARSRPRRCQHRRGC